MQNVAFNSRTIENIKHREIECCFFREPWLGT